MKQSNVFKRSKQHLASVGERYGEHQRIAFRYGFTCIKAGLMALIHGIIPALFETSASDTVKKLAGKERK